MSMNNEWPYSNGEDELLSRLNSKPGITLEEVFEEEDILTHIRMKNDSFSNLYFCFIGGEFILNDLAFQPDPSS